MSLTQSVSHGNGVTLCKFWLIAQKYSFTEMFNKYRIIFFLIFGICFVITIFTANVICVNLRIICQIADFLSLSCLSVFLTVYYMIVYLSMYFSVCLSFFRIFLIVNMNVIYALLWTVIIAMLSNQFCLKILV